MTKYLLDYRGGCKGDFVCNFINYKTVFFEDPYNKSKTVGENFKTFNDFKIEKYLASDVLIIPGHHLYKLDEFLLKKYDRQIIKMFIDEKFMRTASIECVIKDALFSLKKIEILKHLSKDVYHQYANEVKYKVDLELIENNIKLNDINRYNFLIEFLENITMDFDRLKICNQDYKTVEKNIRYEDIFINKDYSVFYDIDATFDSNLFEYFLEQTWLPNIVNCFGYDVDLRKYGYRDY